MSDVTTQIIYQQQQPVLVRRGATIRVIGGPSAGRACSLVDESVFIGSGEGNQLLLDDPQVSRQHLELRPVDRGFLARDLQSSNGTYYRGVRVGEVVLDVGAELRVGQSTLRVERAEEVSSPIHRRERFGSLIGTSQAMQRVYGLLDAVAASDATVLLRGETGTGKELVAEELHRQSRRRGGVLAVLDCGALNAQLVESELFGHERGAFTGATRTHRGIFERAEGGTVFIDELGELPLELQTRLLRVIEDRKVRRVGSDVARRVDVRLVAATNRDLSAELQAGRFRQDLYYRVAVIEIELPPLRRRKEDIPALARHLLWQIGCANTDAILTEELLELLKGRRWPGNVRELRNVLEQAALLAGGEASARQLVADEPAAPRAVASDECVVGEETTHAAAGEQEDTILLPARLFSMEYKKAKAEILERFESVYFGRLRHAHGNNISAIAKTAGVARALVRRLLKRHGLDDAS